MPYKNVIRKTTVGAAIADARSELESLRDEVQEIVDNASEGLSQTQRIVTLADAVGYLDNVDSYATDDAPDEVKDLEITYSEAVNTNKRRGPSRSVRRDNAVAMLTAARERISDWTTDDELEEEPSDERAEAVTTYLDELDTLIGEVEAAEFPGMFG